MKSIFGTRCAHHIIRIAVVGGGLAIGWGAPLAAGAQQAAPAPAQSGPAAVNPGRPSVTDIASLTVPGYLETETGLYYAKGGAGLDYQYSESLVAKVTDKSGANEYRVSSNGFLVQQGDAGNASSAYAQGIGDTTFGVQHLFATQARKSYDIAGRLEYKLPTAGVAIGTGKSDYNLLVLVSKDYTSRVHVDYNAAYALLGRPGLSGYARQGFAAAAISYAPHPNVTVQTELYGFSGNTVNSTNIANGYGVTYTPRPDSEYDAYVSFGISRGAPKALFTVGHTFFLAKLF